MASTTAAFAFQMMSSEMSTKFKNAKTLEEVDELMASFVGYVLSPSCLANALRCMDQFKLISHTRRLEITRRRGSQVAPTACQKLVCGVRLQFWQSSINRILVIFSLMLCAMFICPY